MSRYRLTIAYDGTAFHGWQKQFATAIDGDDPVAGSPRIDGPPDELGRLPLRTVQRIIEQAVREVTRERIELIGASRTDSGVHARHQTAAFTTTDDRRGPPDDRLALALNSRLPDDVLILECRRVHAGFDPIKDCLRKGYSYALHVGPHRPLWDRHYVHHVWMNVDVHAMAKAAAVLVGEHDFAAFAAAGHGRESTVRTIHDCRVERLRTDRIMMHVSGNGFLYNMVRIIAGTLVEVGKGRMTVDDVRAALESKDRRQAGPTLPPEGLCLEWAEYPGDRDAAEPKS